MANVKWLLFFLVSIFVLSASGFAEQYPMLGDIRQVSVTIDRSGVEPNAPPIDWATLQSQIGKRLKEAGIKIASDKGVAPSSICDLKITVIMLSMPETEQFVFHIETSLQRLVSIPEKTNVQFSASVWTSSVTMQSAPVDGISDAITKAAMRQVEAFINAHHIAVIKPMDHNDAAAPKKMVKNGLTPLTKPASSQTYIASKSGKVFHLASCTTAKTISSENLVTFASKAEALASDRRPCKKCNP